MKENKKKLIITSIVILLPILIGIILWNKLPDQVPTHWNAQGEVDGWSSKVFAVFGLPIVLFAVHWMCILVTSVDPKKQNIEGKVLWIVFWICPIISLLVGMLSYGAALGVEFKVDKIMLAIMGIMFIVIGNYLPKCKQSYTVGIKLPWTLNDEENWNCTHRMGGKLWVISGIILLLSMLLPTSAMAIVVLAVVGVSVLVPTVYSYLLFREKEKRGE
ncbi:MAG: SdpI family protein [Tyzzerella sp.]|nr:SdpI family protein [Tyzzerella sp.]